MGDFEEEHEKGRKSGRKVQQREATERVMTGGNGARHTVKRYIPLPWESSGGIDTVRVT